MPDPGAQAGERRPSRIGHSLTAGACLGVQMPSAMRAKPFTVLAAQGLGWKRQQQLLTQDILQQDTILLIITDFSLGSGNGMLRSAAIGPGRSKKQVELAGERVLDGVEATRAEGLEAPLIGGADPNIVDQLARTAVLDNEVGPAVDYQRVQLADIESVFNTAGFKGQIELDRFPFQVNNGNQHGRCHRDATRRRLDLSKG